MIRIAIITIIIFMTSCTTNKTKEELAYNSIDSLFTARYLSETNKQEVLTPGGAVLIMQGDIILFDKGYGIADTKLGTKIDGNTFFNIASVSKQFAAMAILKLYQEGKLNINNSIYDIHPNVNAYLPQQCKPFTDITVKHLLSHSSGIPDSRPRDNKEFTLTATDMESIEYLKNIDTLNFAPGTQYEYMNPTFQLLYIMIEKLSGKSFEQYMKDEIFTPAGMNETMYFAADRKIPRMAHGYVLDSEKHFVEYDYGEETFFATKADGGIYTSTHEFAAWEKALRKNVIINKELTNEAHSPVTLISGSTYSSYQNRPNTSYGYGWFIEEKPNMPKKVYHTGDNGGFQIYAGRFPQKELLILVFENRNDQDRWKMVEKLDDIVKRAGWLD
ncbi:MAG: serine hydrolase domain-containing protein [Bacteroidales bacterium]